MTQGDKVKQSWESTSQILVSLDLETTGLKKNEDDIIEVGAVKFRDREILDTFSTLVKPNCPLPEFVQSLTGITPRDLEKAPDFSSISMEVETFVGDHAIVGHNIEFDLAFLARKGVRFSGPSYDTLDLSSMLLPTSSGYSLLEVCRTLGVEHERPHRAVSDAEMTAYAFMALRERLNSLDQDLLAELRGIWRKVDWSLANLLGPTRQEDDIVHRPLVTTTLEGVDADNLSDRLSCEAPLVQTTASEPISVEAVVDAFKEGGALSETLGGFETRPEQISMAEAVTEAFNEGQHVILEAGTGTGKSLAYLLPSAVFASKNSQRVVLSTNTINLQEQLLEKDIPNALIGLSNVHGSDGAKVGAAVLKGKANYLCLRKWTTLKRGDSLNVAEARLASKVLLWLQITNTGDRSELRLLGPEATVWSRIAASSFDAGTGPCPYARQALCFYEAARRRAESAQLVVINHALLALSTRHENLIPEHSHLIVDEAHNLEDVATSQLSTQVGDDSIDEFLGRILGLTTTGGGAVLGPFRNAARDPELGESRRSDMNDLLGDIEKSVEHARGQLPLFFKMLADFAAQAGDGGDYELRLVLNSSVRTQPAWSNIEVAWEDVNILLDRICHGLTRLHSSGQQLPHGLIKDQEERLGDLLLAEQEGRQLRETLAAAITNPGDKDINWLSVGRRDGTVRLNMAPLHVGPLLKENIFDDKQTLILTGATLSTEGTFEFVKDRLLIEPVKELDLGTPFNYQRLAMVYIPDDIPEPNHPRYQGMLEHAIANVARAVKGRTLVLFTSRLAVRRTRDKLREILSQDDLKILGQGVDGNPRQLLETFRNTPNTILLGTGSFWEGVDVPGEALSVLIVARLPFSVPTDPIFKARSEQFDDSFNHYSVPQSVIRFKQGFGRLIRRKSDRGVFVILDRRVQSKQYGPAFLESIPRCTRQSGPTDHLGNAANAWLSQAPLG